MTVHHARIFTATLPDGPQVLVTIWPGDNGGEIAFRPSATPSITWGVPTTLVEES